MSKVFVRALIGASVLSLSALASAQQIKPEDQIKFRQSTYSFMAWNMQKIKAQLEGNAFDKNVTLNAALAIKGAANAGIGALYSADSSKDVGAMKTNVKPDLFDPKNGDEVKKVATAFNQEANKLADVAAGGDAAAIKAQFGKLGETCKACHDKFRKEKN